MNKDRDNQASINTTQPCRLSGAEEIEDFLIRVMKKIDSTYVRMESLLKPVCNVLPENQSVEEDVAVDEIAPLFYEYRFHLFKIENTITKINRLLNTIDLPEK